jgi:hypothetical protein
MDLDELLAAQLAAEKNNADDDDDDDDEDGDPSDDFSALSEEALLTKARESVTAKEYDDACDMFSAVLNRRRDNGVDDLAIANAPGKLL